jgi:hypothetical protein
LNIHLLNGQRKKQSTLDEVEKQKRNLIFETGYKKMNQTTDNK